MLTEAKIIQAAGLSNTYYKGCQYFSEGKIQQISYHPATGIFNAVVQGRYAYEVEVSFDDNDEMDGSDCECPASREYDSVCKHVVAVLKDIQRNWSTYFGEIDISILHAPVRDLLDFFERDAQGTSPSKISFPEVHLVPTLFISARASHRAIWVEFSIGRDRPYILKNVRRFLEAHASGAQLVYGRKYTYRPTEDRFDYNSQQLLEMMQIADVDEKTFLASWGNIYESRTFHERRFNLSNTQLLRFLEIMGEESFDIVFNSGLRQTVRISEARPSLTFAVSALASGLKVSMVLGEEACYGLDSDFRYVYYANTVHRVDDSYSRYMRPLLQCFSQMRQAEVVIPESNVGQFLDTVVPTLEKIATVHVDSALASRFYREQLQAEVYLDRHGDGASARVRFKYGAEVVDPLDAKTVSNGGEKRVLIRSASDEKKILLLLQRFGFRASNTAFVLEDEDETYNFLLAGLPELANLAEVYYAEQFKNMRLQNPGKVSAGVRLNNSKGLLEMSLQYGDMTPQDLIELLSAYKLKKRYHRLKSGTFVSLESPEFKTTAALVDQLGITPAELKNQVAELPKYRALYLDSLSRETEGFQLERSSAFKKMVQDIREPQDMEYEVPAGINGKLRDYQKTGFRWLKSLAHYGLGGILADDMGLGKTLQVIAFVLSEKAVEQKPSLVIAPTSLVYNWLEEVRKFSPELRVAIITGQPGERQQRLTEINAADLVVTSYALIKRDIELYSAIDFKYCFVDEAQNIKNPHTLNAKSVKQIKARGYFALTGTPVENSLTELWSIFDFLMPGYLFNHTRFTTKYETPIVKNGDKTALQQLGRHIRPFILRRMKKDVLKELPEKVESKISCDMTEQQAKLYASYILAAQQEFKDVVEAQGFEQSRIKILAILMRLRQVCCHPGMFLENYADGSGKLDTLLEILHDALSGGHRVLVFSQFTTMLALIADQLKAAGIQYHYLDGNTPALERMRLVNAFNAGEKPLFLLSLKAGGTGLNLTGADMVIHCDPWWNPAVEDQATDRAYRIGQQNSVQVYKLIARNTIEERIFELQQAKKELIDAVIKPGETFLTKMREEEIRQLFVTDAALA
ncbi:MAG: SNF2-related protein [Bacillota bacterium]|nr:MAG: SNF2-related protein [Bacillota bacterium]MBS3950216.1 SNF2 helicase associated domain-containing protein [Peptococcaceae bacterium]